MAWPGVAFHIVPALVWQALALLLICSPLLQGCRRACLLVSLFRIGSLDGRVIPVECSWKANDWLLNASL